MQIGYDAKRIFHNTTGLGNYGRDLIRILAYYYPENQYILYNPKPAKINRLKIENNIIVKQPQTWLSKKLPFLWRSKLINKDLLNDKPDIFHGLSGELPFGIQENSIKSVVTIHDLIFLHFPELYKPIDRKIYTAKFKYAAQKADKVVAISRQTKNDLIKFFGVPSYKIEVIYQGCHQVFKKTYSEDEKLNLKLKYKLPDNFILNVGTIEPRKNAFSIVKAIKGTDYNLVLVGRKTAYAEKIITYIKKHQMDKQIIFLEGLELKDLAILYQTADIFVYPSIYEGFGIPIIEALFSKIPVITNKNGVFPEAAGPHSYYVEDVKKPDAIKKMITYVYQNKNQEQTEKSYRFALDNFSDQVIANNYNNLYLKLKNE